MANTLLVKTVPVDIVIHAYLMSYFMAKVDLAPATNWSERVIHHYRPPSGIQTKSGIIL